MKRRMIPRDEIMYTCTNEKGVIGVIVRRWRAMGVSDRRYTYLAWIGGIAFLVPTPRGATFTSGGGFPGQASTVSMD